MFLIFFNLLWEISSTVPTKIIRQPFRIFFFLNSFNNSRSKINENRSRNDQGISCDISFGKITLVVLSRIKQQYLWDSFWDFFFGNFWGNYFNSCFKNLFGNYFGNWFWYFFFLKIPKLRHIYWKCLQL